MIKLQVLSLAKRILFASLILLPILLGFSALMLERAFRSSLINAEKSAFLTHTYSMMSLAEPVEGFLLLPEKLTDSRFNDPESGLYAQVVDDDFGAIWQSISLEISPYNAEIPVKKVPLGQHDFETFSLGDKDFFISRFNTVWEIDGLDREYQFTVIHTQDAFKDEIFRYRSQLLAWLGGLALLLIVTQTFIIRWGLFPLKRLARDIHHLKSAEIEKLDKHYPGEIIPVIDSLNLVLDSEKERRTRYKNTLGDLAHSLKTPLTIIRNNLDTEPNSINEQVERMNAIISHQLSRASTSIETSAFQAATPIKPIIERIGKALSKVYQEKNTAFTNNIGEDVSYKASADDLMELLGNLLENAFKYGNDQVCASAKITDNDLTIAIEDNGRGIPEDLHQEILQRGARADTSTTGQGIGLAITTDILSAYGGGLKIESSTLGGAKFVISLPLKN